MQIHCINCQSALAVEYKYCFNCSQKTNIHRLTLHSVIHDGFHFFTHADKSFLSLIKHLLVHSGIVAKEYVEGKRKKHFPPLNFFLIVAAIFVVVMGLFNNQDVPSNYTSESAISAIQKRQLLAIAFMNKYANIVAMIATPFICLIYRLFYSKTEYNYTEHLIACMYMTGLTNLIYAVVVIPIAFLIGLNTYIPVLILALLQISYNTSFYHRFTADKTSSGLGRAFISSFTAIVAWYIVSSFLVGAYIKNGLWGILM